MDQYKINLFNLQASTKKMWCFLGEPVSNITNEIYGNSNTFLSVPLYTGSQESSFTIPLQYIVEAKASVQPVGSSTLISSELRENTELGEEWLASYFQAEGERLPPTLEKTGTTPEEEFAIVTNAYDKSAESHNSWYGSLTYGLESVSGFLGLTWSPDPMTTYQIKPKDTFYVAIGSYLSNELVNMNIVTENSASILKSDFSFHLEATVIYKTDGTWEVRSGYAPPTAEDILLAHANIHLERTIAHKEFIELAIAKIKEMA